jgi:hypothetical protein
MPLARLQVPPGVVKSNTPYTQPGRYIDAQWVRFQGGFPEKRGGRELFDEGIQPFIGTCRGALQWEDNRSNKRLALGTSSKLYVYENAVLSDITPLRQLTTGTLAGPLSTGSGSSIVQVFDTAHLLQQNDWVQLTASAPVGGLTIAGVYLVQSVIDANHYTIDAGTMAPATETGGGGTVSYVYYHLLLDPNPLSTTAGSSHVVVAHPNNGVAEKDVVLISGATPVGGLTINGSYTIITAMGNSYTIDAGAVATSTATGGGSTVRVQLELAGGTDTAADYHGYGLGRYGLSTYGTVRAGVIRLDLRTWHLDAYGEWLLANPNGGAIYKWDPNLKDVNIRAVELYGAPIQCEAMFVTPERYIIALGTDGVKLKLRWPDQLVPTDWLTSESNTANQDRRVQGGSRLITGRVIRNGVNLLWTDTQAFTHQWRTDDLIFTTLGLGNGTGIFGPHAGCVLGEAGYWVGDGAFWKWDGGLSQLPSDDIREWFFENIDRRQRTKVFMGPYASKNELIILYQELNQSEINRYLIYNTLTNVWTPGFATITTWLDRELFDCPISFLPNGLILYEEYIGGDDYDGTPIPSYIEAGQTDIEDGNKNTDVVGFWPDIRYQQGPLVLRVQLRPENSQDSIVSAGPFTLNVAGEHVDLRESGQAVGYRIESNALGGSWRLGVCRADVQPGGQR